MSFEREVCLFLIALVDETRQSLDWCVEHGDLDKSALMLADHLQQCLGLQKGILMLVDSVRATIPVLAPGVSDPREQERMARLRQLIADSQANIAAHDD